MASLTTFGCHKFDAAAMEKFAGPDVTARFEQALIDGIPTDQADSSAIEQALFAFCETHGCTNYAHW